MTARCWHKDRRAGFKGRSPEADPHRQCCSTDADGESVGNEVSGTNHAGIIGPHTICK